MIYLSAQPDQYYFVWQLEIQLFNFHKLGIPRENIHVLIGYDKTAGLSEDFKKLIKQHENISSFFPYPDERKRCKYASSLRPNIIRQHFETFQFLEREAIFYHDSDIIFREIPDFDNMLKDTNWYVSDTRGYLDSSYIKRTASDYIFGEMCRIIGIGEDVPVENDMNCGGAQYLIKNVSTTFWEKTENDSESIYQLLESNNWDRANEIAQETGDKISHYNGIQSWCSDMWALLWNGWHFGYKIQIHKELNFCWATLDIQNWQQTKILHYSGAVEQNDVRYFRKLNYTLCSPFDDDSLSKVNKNSCSYPLVCLIDEIKREREKKKYNLKDVTFLIPVKVDSRSRLENLLIVITYLNKYFYTNILIAESDSSPKIEKARLPVFCDYFFIKDGAPLFNHTKANNKLITFSKTEIIAIYDTDVILPVDQIIKAVEQLRTGVCQIIYPYDGTFVSVDWSFRSFFMKIMDTQLFTANKGKFKIETTRSHGGAVFMIKEDYIAAGMDNEFFVSWGPEDIERVKRMKILGYELKRIYGAIYHLPHNRTKNSDYNGPDAYAGYMEEYFKICNMSKNELLNYIASWPRPKHNTIA